MTLLHIQYRYFKANISRPQEEQQAAVILQDIIGPILYSYYTRVPVLRCMWLGAERKKAVTVQSHPAAQAPSSASQASKVTDYPPPKSSKCYSLAPPLSILLPRNAFQCLTAKIMIRMKEDTGNGGVTTSPTDWWTKRVPARVRAYDTLLRYFLSGRSRNLDSPPWPVFTFFDHLFSKGGTGWQICGFPSLTSPKPSCHSRTWSRSWLPVLRQGSCRLIHPHTYHTHTFQAGALIRFFCLTKELR